MKLHVSQVRLVRYNFPHFSHLSYNLNTSKTTKSQFCSRYSSFLRYSTTGGPILPLKTPRQIIRGWVGVRAYLVSQLLRWVSGGISGGWKLTGNESKQFEHWFWLFSHDNSLKYNEFNIFQCNHFLNSFLIDINFVWGVNNKLIWS